MATPDPAARPAASAPVSVPVAASASPAGSVAVGASSPASGRPPKALAPRKASTAAECERLEQLPNIGPSLAADLRRLGIAHPRELAQADALELYHRLGRLAGRRQDPCVLDTFMAATDFMAGAAPHPWWHYTPLRKARYGAV